jgi:hypothetical protein
MELGSYLFLQEQIQDIITIIIIMEQNLAKRQRPSAGAAGRSDEYKPTYMCIYNTINLLSE